MFPIIISTYILLGLVYIKHTGKIMCDYSVRIHTLQMV